MRYRRLGSSGLEVSTLCLGTMTFGEVSADSFMHKVGCSEEEAHRILDRAVDAGVNFIDTADVYGNDGLIEKVVGRWLRRSGRRDELVLATKCRFRTRPGPNGTGASRKHVMEAVEASLGRLQTDYVDLYQIHMQDVAVPEEETLRALDDLVRQGKVRYVGGSNYAAYRMVESLFTSREQRLERFVSMQMQYSLAERGIEREHVPACEKLGVGILSWSPLAGGLLTGKFRRGEAPPPGTRMEKWRDRLASFDSERNWALVDAIRAVAGELGTTPSAISLAWVVSRPAVSSAIFGARSVEQLEGNLAAADLTLPAEALARLDEVSAVAPGYPYDFMKRIDGRW